MQYFVTPAHRVAVNLKVGTASVAAAIVHRFYPERLEHAGELHELTGRSLVEQTDAPDKPVLLLVREPVDRFLSACAMLGLTVDEGLGSDDIHLQPQADFLPAAAFRFPDHLDAFAAAAGLAALPHLNRGGSKPVPTAHQVAAIERRYARDVELYRQTAAPSVIGALSPATARILSNLKGLPHG